MLATSSTAPASAKRERKDLDLSTENSLLVEVA
jgi:hypothetical protein